MTCGICSTGRNGKKRTLGESRRGRLQGGAVGTVTYEHEAGIFVAQNFRGLQERVPCAVETEISGV